MHTSLNDDPNNMRRRVVSVVTVGHALHAGQTQPQQRAASAFLQSGAMYRPHVVASALCSNHRSQRHVLSLVLDLLNGSSPQDFNDSRRVILQIVLLKILLNDSVGTQRFTW